MQQQQQQPDEVSAIAVQLPMDGFHLYKRQLNAMADPVAAHARRGAHWTFDAEAFVGAVKQVGAGGQLQGARRLPIAWGRGAPHELRVVAPIY